MSTRLKIRIIAVSCMVAETITTNARSKLGTAVEDRSVRSIWKLSLSESIPTDNLRSFLSSVSVKVKLSVVMFRAELSISYDYWSHCS